MIIEIGTSDLCLEAEETGHVIGGGSGGEVLSKPLTKTGGKAVLKRIHRYLIIYTTSGREFNTT